MNMKILLTTKGLDSLEEQGLWQKKNLIETPADLKNKNKR